eukprot:332665_1
MVNLNLTVYVIVRLFLVGISIFWLIPATSIILYYYWKNKDKLNANPLMFKGGFCYFLFTPLFCINYCTNLLYESLSNSNELDTIFLLTGTFFNGAQLIWLIALLFGRIYFIFNETAYKVSNTTMYIFISLCIFEIFDVTFYVLLQTGDISVNKHHEFAFLTYFIGVINMLVLVLWITILYVYKLFQIISNTGNSCGTVSEKLLTIMTKHTVLALIWISTSICFWCIPFALKPFLNSDIYLLLYHGFILLDVNANAFTFLLGFQFAHKMYLKCCSCTHNKCKKMFKHILVVKTVKPTKDKVHISEMVAPKTKVYAMAKSTATPSIVSPDVSTYIGPNRYAIKTNINENILDALPAITPHIVTVPSISEESEMVERSSDIIHNSDDKHADSPIPKSSSNNTLKPYEVSGKGLASIPSNREMVFPESPETPLI